MEEIVQRLGWKKIALILVVLGIIAMGLLFLSFSSEGRDLLPQPEIVTPTPLQTERETQDNPGSSNTLYPEDLWSTYRTSGYEIKFPKDWKAQEYNLEKGQAVYISPSAFVASKHNKILVEAVPTQNITLAKRRDQLMRAGFKEAPYVLGGVPTVKFAAAIKIPEPNGGMVTIQESYLLVEKKNTLFLIGYEYVNNEKDPQEEGLFDKVAGSFLIY